MTRPTRATSPRSAAWSPRCRSWPAAGGHRLGRESDPGPDHGAGAGGDREGERASPVTFDLTLTFGDLLLMLPELWVTLGICVVLCVDFLMPRLSQRTIGGLSVAGGGGAPVFLPWGYPGAAGGGLF